MKKFVTALVGFSLFASVQASELKADLVKIKQKFSEISLTVNSVEAPVNGLFPVFTDRGLFFTSFDGQYFIEANIYDLENQELINDKLMRPYIKQQMVKQQDSAIVFKAKNEKFVIDVFTDPSCGYCRKLHNEMKAYNDAGITVRYLALPRGGEQSETYLQMQHIWCAKDQKSAMGDAKAGKTVKAAMCKNPVKEHYALSASLGINGTPAVILPNGRLIGGYQPLDALLAQLKSGE